LDEGATLSYVSDHPNARRDSWPVNGKAGTIVAPFSADLMRLLRPFNPEASMNSKAAIGWAARK
jgi:hypothetical protein